MCIMNGKQLAPILKCLEREPQRENLEVALVSGTLYTLESLTQLHLSLSPSLPLPLHLLSSSPSSLYSSPPPLPFGIQTQGFIVHGPGCPPFSPPPPHLLGPFPFIPPQFNHGFGYGPPFFQSPMSVPQFPLQQAMPPLVPYNVAN